MKLSRTFMFRTQLKRFFAVLMFAKLLSSTIGYSADPITKQDLEKVFETFDAAGTIVIKDDRSERPTTWIVNPDRAHQRFSPASTYKLPHTLFALDSGAASDEFQIFPWDGAKHAYAPHNQDQTLRSALRHSAVWVYENFADKIGEERAHEYLEKIGYGNTDPRTRQRPYWIEGNLAISAEEQITFLRRLYTNALPFSIEHQRLLKDLMINQADAEWILRAKTGWDGKIGWWIGWVEWPEGPVFFALNIDTPNEMADLFKRQAITRAVLRTIDALPAEA